MSDNLIMHETFDNPTPTLKRRLITIKIDSDEKMIAFHDFMISGCDIITQIERLNGVCYVLLQKLEGVALKEVVEAEKTKGEKKDEK